MNHRKKIALSLAALAVVGLGIVAVARWRGGACSSAEGGGSPKVRLTVFLRLHDPAIAHAIPNLLEVVDRIGGLAVIEAHVLATAGGGIDEALASCSARPDGAKGLRFIACRQGMGQGNDDWAPCAEDAGLDKVALDRCAKAEEAVSLLAASDAAARSLGVSSTPAIFVNGTAAEGDGTRAAVRRAICEAMDPAPDLCEEEPSKPSGGFPIVVMTDSRCPDCRAPFWFRRMQMLFPSADVRIVDVAEAAHRAHYDAVAPGLLPAILLDARVEGDSGFARLRRELVKKGDGYQLSPTTVRPSFDPAR